MNEIESRLTDDFHKFMIDNIDQDAGGQEHLDYLISTVKREIKLVLEDIKIRVSISSVSFDVVSKAIAKLEEGE